MEDLRIAVFASGQGSNARAIFRALQYEDGVEARLLLSDRSCGAIDVAREEGVEAVRLSKKERNDGVTMLSVLRERGIGMIVLAGYFRKVPQEVVEAYRDRILNVHPALLPKFGGKGMYGERVHQAVLDAGESKSGISVHLVDEEYDRGAVLFQKECEVRPEDDADTLAERVKALEHEHYPRVVLEKARELMKAES